MQANKINNSNPIAVGLFLLFKETSAHFKAIILNKLLSFALQQTYAEEKNNNKIYNGTNVLELFSKMFPSIPYLIEFQLIVVVIQPKIHSITGIKE